MKETAVKRRSAIKIMGSLIGLVKPLMHIMAAAILLGTAGYLCAIFLTIFAGSALIHGILMGAADITVKITAGSFFAMPVRTLIIGHGHDSRFAWNFTLCRAVL